MLEFENIEELNRVLEELLGFEDVKTPGLNFTAEGN